MSTNPSVYKRADNYPPKIDSLVMSPWVVVLVLAGAVLRVHWADGAMSMPAFRQSKAMMASICQPRTGVSRDLLKTLNNGEFPQTDNRKFKCYFECILRMGNAMKGTAISKDSLNRLANTMIPKELKSLVMPSIEACGNIDEGDACETAFAFVKCHHNASGPQGFMFA